jgi:hypothetical protein
MNRLSKKEFFDANPRCIFCGNRSAAEERDHQPGRNLFDERVWPEGYEFPTCVPCNRATANDELLVDTFARFTSCLDSRETMQDVNARFKRLFDQFPDLTWALRMTDNQRRRIRRANPGKAGAVLNFPEELRCRFNRVAYKLGAALHYRHADGQIIPPDGGCMVDIVPNNDPGLNRQGDDILRQLAEQRANPAANRRSLSEQFEYDFWAREGKVGLCAIRFRKHFRFVVSVMMDPGDYAALESIPEISGKLIKPFDPTEASAPGHHQHRRPNGIYRWRVLTELN